MNTACSQQQSFYSLHSKSLSHLLLSSSTIRVLTVYEPERASMPEGDSSEANWAHVSATHHERQRSCTHHLGVGLGLGAVRAKHGLGLYNLSAFLCLFPWPGAPGTPGHWGSFPERTDLVN